MTATGSGPVPVALPQSAFGVTTAAYWPIYPPTTFYWTYATFGNDAGAFLAGGGPAAGKGTVSHKGNGNRVGSWFIREGKNAFGGTLGLLGKLGAFAQFQIKTSGPSLPLPGIFTGTSSWNMIRALGRDPMDPLNPYTNTATFINKTGGTVTTYTKFASGTPWTTGTVTVYATVGSLTTSFRRSGYDTTTPGGVRNIQLVTPTLTHWKRGHGRPFNHTGHIAILKIQLVPEPSGLAMFSAGVCALLLLQRSFHSSSRRDFTA
ncbi:MAG: hypothetical protein IH827_07205 [Myxococcales bacterium]|nr:hypothetical protein [Myxococcales bacterium]